MTKVPRLQNGFNGSSLKMNTLILLYSTLTINFVVLVIKTSIGMGVETNQNLDESVDQFDIRYVVNMVVAIFLFLITPLAIYGVYKERANFILPYLFAHLIGTVLLAVNTLIEFLEWINGSATSSKVAVLFLVIITALFAYSMLILYSFFLQMKEQREEI